MIAFIVRGIPAPQGSKTPYGTEDNPHTRPWRATVAEAAARELDGDGPLTGAVQVRVLFVFPRPKTHYGRGGNADRLRPSAPVYHTVYPDLDKLERAIGDALSGTLLRDDKQIVSWSTFKVYGNDPRAEIVALPLPLKKGDG